MPTYLDPNGNPTTAPPQTGKSYLDENGNPVVGSATAAGPGRGGHMPPGSPVAQAPDPSTLPPMGRFAGGVDQMLNLGGNRPGQRLAGAHNAIVGAGELAAPLALPYAVAAPIPALIGAGTGLAAQFAGSEIPRAMGASPEVSDLIGDVAGLAGGTGGGKLAQLGGRAAAEGAMNSAVGAGIRAKGFGARPGYFGLTETTGTAPSDLQASGSRRIGDINRAYEANIANAPPVSLSPARSVTGAAISGTRNPETATALDPIHQSLFGNRMTGQPYDEYVPASEALDIKRNIGDLVDWKPQDRTSTANRAGRSAYGALGDTIHEAAPGSKELATRMQNGIPFIGRAGTADLTAGPMETGINRMTRPTGGMIPMLMALHGYGPLGAVGELAGQESLASPRGKAMLARALWRGVGGERFDAPEMPMRRLTGGEGESGPLPPGVADMRNATAGFRDQRLLSPASSQIGVNGVTVPDILARSTRGHGTPTPLLEAATGNPSAGVVQPQSEVSGPGARTFGPSTRRPAAPIGSSDLIDPNHPLALPAPTIERRLPPSTTSPYREPRTLPGTTDTGNDVFSLSTRPVPVREPGDTPRAGKPVQSINRDARRALSIPGEPASEPTPETSNQIQLPAEMAQKLKDGKSLTMRDLNQLFGPSK